MSSSSVLRGTPLLLSLFAASAGADGLPAIAPADMPEAFVQSFRIRNLPANPGEQVTTVDRDLLDLAALDLWIGLAGKFRSHAGPDEVARTLARPDYSLQVDADRPLGPLLLIGTVGYRWGPPPTNTGMRNTWFGFGGLAYRPDADSEIGVIADHRQSAYIGNAPLREVSAYATRWIDTDLRVRAYIYRTVLEPRPEWGLGFGASVTF